VTPAPIGVEEIIETQRQDGRNAFILVDEQGRRERRGSKRSRRVSFNVGHGVDEDSHENGDPSEV